MQQLVDTITVSDGRGNARTTSYTYGNGRYDFINRRALGYDTVTATLEALPGVRSVATENRSRAPCRMNM